MENFILCHKCDDASNVASLIIEHVIKMHEIPNTIISDRDQSTLVILWDHYG